MNVNVPGVPLPQNIPPPPLTPLQHCLFACQLTAAQIVSINAYERIVSLQQFGSAFRDKGQIDSMVKRLNQTLLTINPRYTLGQIHIANLYSLWDWIFDCKRQGQDLDYQQFSLDTINFYQEEAVRDEASKSNKDADVKPPPLLQSTVTGWIEWADQAENFLRQIRGCVGSTLAYVIRRDDRRPVFLDRENELLYRMRLDGDNFRIDNIKVYQYLKQWLRKTEAWVWMSKHDITQDGRAAMMSLRDHFEGASHVSSRKAHYMKMLKDLNYRSESNRPFDNFAAKFKEAYQGLADCNEVYSERHKVDDFLDKINSNHLPVIAAISNVWMMNTINPNFESALALMTQMMQCINPSASLDVGGRARNISETNRGNGRGYNRGYGRNNRGGSQYSGNSQGSGNKRYHNGIDITDATKSFTTEEWRSFPENIVNDINSRRHQASTARRGGGGGGRSY